MIETGGPAFPLDLKVGDDHYWAHGMNLRDYMAAKAMQGMLADSVNISNQDLADFAYAVADAMLIERLKDQP